jgi:hypothetical protein
MIKDMRNQYNLVGKKICFKQIFNQDAIRRINEQLQTWIDRNKVIFASKLVASNDYESSLKEGIPYPFDDEDIKMGNKEKFIYNLVEMQDDWIYQVKKQLSLIEVGTSAIGKLTFDLPHNLKRDSNPKRARKDNYTTLLLGVEAAQAYLNIMKQEPAQRQPMWGGIMIGNSTLSN